MLYFLVVKCDFLRYKDVGEIVLRHKSLVVISGSRFFALILLIFFKKVKHTLNTLISEQTLPPTEEKLQLFS